MVGNLLAQERSVYLLQHAQNPVDWYPWKEEAFLAAKKRDCPIFLSIGYASCHWCHVMEEEAFSDLETSHLLNASFVNIKVDREERPEIDRLYMELAEILMGSSAGWPLNVFLTPDLKPFFAATYLSIASLQELSQKVMQIWNSPDREKLYEQSQALLNYVIRHNSLKESTLPSQKEVLLGIERLLEEADFVFGGLQGAPKFPLSYPSFLLIASVHFFKDNRCLAFLETSLQKMFEGGIFDHLGGGFCRYSVDERWQVPHFEKMLIDNVLLAGAYLETWKLTKKPLYAQICREILDYILQNLKGSNGEFFSAEDADSSGEEGSYYLWDFKEVKKALTSDQFLVFCQVYDIKQEGSFQGKNILHLVEPLEEVQENSRFDESSFQTLLQSARKVLLQERLKRNPPLKDDLIVSSWNGAAIDIFIQAASSFKEKRYEKAAEEAAFFIKNNLWNEGKLLRCWYKGKGTVEGCLEDYAYCIRAFLTLFEEGKGTSWLSWALEMSEILRKEFKEVKSAFYGSKFDSSLIVRYFRFHDGAQPSGNSIQVRNLVRLYQITRKACFKEQAEDVFKAMKEHMESFPLSALDSISSFFQFIHEKTATWVIALDENDSGRVEIQEALGSVYKPHISVVWLESQDTELCILAPYLKEKKALEGKTTLHICLADRCIAPINDLSQILEKIWHCLRI